MVWVCVLGNKPVPVEYKPDMKAWQYLREFIVPAAPSIIKLDREQVSVRGCLIHYAYFSSDTTGINTDFCFNFENRLERIGDVMPADANILVAPYYRDPDNMLWGNAVAADVRADCAICMVTEKHTDCTLKCGHRFHGQCVSRWLRRTCPICRTPYTMPGSIVVTARILHNHLQTAPPIWDFARNAMAGPPPVVFLEHAPTLQGQVVGESVRRPSI